MGLADGLDNLITPYTPLSPHLSNPFAPSQDLAPVSRPQLSPDIHVKPVDPIGVEQVILNLRLERPINQLVHLVAKGFAKSHDDPDHHGDQEHILRRRLARLIGEKSS